MSSWRRLRMRIQRALYLPAGADRELDDEIRFHLAEETRLQAERGLSATEAATAARRGFGNIAIAKENTRAVWVSSRRERRLSTSVTADRKAHSVRRWRRLSERSMLGLPLPACDLSRAR